MKVLGIITEYNPMHLGHLYHLNKAKELIKPNITICVMSTYFVERGEVAIINPYTRSQIAINNGIDLIVALPISYALQSADYFAYGAMKILNLLGVTDIVFGSESNDIETLFEISRAIYNNESNYNLFIKKFMNQGLRYADATNKALVSLLNHDIRTPNDLLGLAYIKEIVKNNYPINAHTIKRTNSYHSEKIENISSATAIRQALKNHQNINDQIVDYELFSSQVYLNNEIFFPYLKHIILTYPYLNEIHLVEEGLDHKLHNCIQDANSFEHLVSMLTSKRYTRARIKRMLLHIYMLNTKKFMTQAMILKQIKVLGFNKKGQQYLKKLNTIPVQTKIIDNNDAMYQLEYKAASLLQSFDKTILNFEKSNKPYIKKA